MVIKLICSENDSIFTVINEFSKLLRLVKISKDKEVKLDFSECKLQYFSPCPREDAIEVEMLYIQTLNLIRIQFFHILPK